MDYAIFQKPKEIRQKYWHKKNIMNVGKKNWRAKPLDGKLI